MDFKSFIDDIESRKNELSESFLSNELLSCMKQLERTLNAVNIKVNVIKEDKLFNENKSPFYAMRGIEVDLLEHDKKKDSEIEKCKAALDFSKQELNKIISKYRNENGKLQYEVKKLKESQEEMPIEPIKIAEWLIGRRSDSIPIYSTSGLQEIAEYLTVYCNHNTRGIRMTANDIHNIENRLNEMLDVNTYEKINMTPREVEESLNRIERARYKQEFYESMCCNFTVCRYNQSGICGNKDIREECIEVSRKVLCMEEDL